MPTMSRSLNSQNPTVSPRRIWPFMPEAMSCAMAVSELPERFFMPEEISRMNR